MKRLLLLRIMILTGLVLISAACAQPPHTIPPASNVHPAISATAVPTAPPTPTPLPTLTPPPPVTPFPGELQQEVAVLKAHDRLFNQGNPTLSEIALTFDDGPHAYSTPKILAILRHYRINATFFCVGYLVKRHPDLVQQEYAAGHLVGNHSWSHPYLPSLASSKILWQLAMTSETIQKAIGRRPTFFRPPYGAYDTKVLTQANRLGLTIVMWNVDPEDWSMPGSKTIISRVLRRVGSGSIILMHDGGGMRAQTVQALPTIIESLLRRGFTFVTLQQMADHLHRKSHQSITPAHTINSSATVLRGYPLSRRRKDVWTP
ncbi:MAG TPA: polysaccharide deacetylase family protein [Ktedonobacteraceae bacterium]